MSAFLEALTSHDSPKNRAPARPAISRRDLAAVLLLSVVLAAVSYFVNQYDGAYLIRSDAVWENNLEFHQTYHPFATRVFTTTLMQIGHEQFGLRLVTAFAIIQYSLFIVLGPLCFVFLRHAGLRRSSSYLGVLVMLTAYPILAAFHMPIYTWDDFWMYGAIMLTFTLAFRARLIIASLVFGVGILARDPIILFYPILVLAVCQSPGSRATKIIAALSPLVIYFVFIIFAMEPPDQARWMNFSKNFLKPDWAKNTAFSFVAGMGILWLSAPVAGVRLGQTLLRLNIPRLILIGAAFITPLTVLTALTMGLARETRLFFPPVFFALPLSLYLLEYYTRFHKKPRSWLLAAGLAAMGASAWLGIQIARFVFPQLEGRTWPAFFQAHLGVNIGLGICFLLFVIYRIVRTTPRLQKPSSSKYVQ